MRFRLAHLVLVLLVTPICVQTPASSAPPNQSQTLSPAERKIGRQMLRDIVGLLLAVAEAARYGQGGQHLKRVTIVVFKPDADIPAVDQVIVRRALALIGTGK
jgi:hypothetical protein